MPIQVFLFMRLKKWVALLSPPDAVNCKWFTVSRNDIRKSVPNTAFHHLTFLLMYLTDKLRVFYK